MRRYFVPPAGAEEERNAAWTPERRASRMRAWLAATAAWGRHAKTSKRARRRAAEIQRSPAWANAFFISEAYDLAQRRTVATGTPHHVDHIVPLRGRTVSGLHVENNLQVIPARDNLRKGNRHGG